jgi:hypothetical protein
MKYPGSDRCTLFRSGYGLAGSLASPTWIIRPAVSSCDRPTGTALLAGNTPKVPGIAPSETSRYRHSARTTGKGVQPGGDGVAAELFDPLT